MELRENQRQKTFIGARIERGGLIEMLPCTVRNIGEKGARLDLIAPLSVKQTFHLVIPQKGRRIKAKLIWRNGETIGVRFLKDEAIPSRRPNYDDLLAELQACEKRRVDLEKRLNRLNDGI